MINRGNDRFVNDQNQAMESLKPGYYEDLVIPANVLLSNGSPYDKFLRKCFIGSSITIPDSIVVNDWTKVCVPLAPDYNCKKELLIFLPAVKSNYTDDKISPSLSIHYGKLDVSDISDPRSAKVVLAEGTEILPDLFMDNNEGDVTFSVVFPTSLMEIGRDAFYMTHGDTAYIPAGSQYDWYIDQLRNFRKYERYNPEEVDDVIHSPNTRRQMSVDEVNQYRLDITRYNNMFDHDRHVCQLDKVKSAAHSCENLILPESINEICADAFWKADIHHSIQFPHNLAYESTLIGMDLHTSRFDGEELTLYVPSVKDNNKKAAPRIGFYDSSLMSPQWSDDNEEKPRTFNRPVRIELEEGIESIKKDFIGGFAEYDDMFHEDIYRADYIEFTEELPSECIFSVVFPTTVREISPDAFYMCQGETAFIPEGSQYDWMIDTLKQTNAFRKYERYVPNGKKSVSRKSGTKSAKKAVKNPGISEMKEKIALLKDLKELLDAGILTEEEFIQQKSKILG